MFIQGSGSCLRFRMLNFIGYYATRGGGLAFSERCLINRIPDLARIAFASLDKIGIIFWFASLDFLVDKVPKFSKHMPMVSRARFPRFPMMIVSITHCNAYFWSHPSRVNSVQATPFDWGVVVRHLLKKAYSKLKQHRYCCPHCQLNAKGRRSGYSKRRRGCGSCRSGIQWSLGLL